MFYMGIYNSFVGVGIVFLLFLFFRLFFSLLLGYYVGFLMMCVGRFVL